MSFLVQELQSVFKSVFTVVLQIILHRLSHHFAFDSTLINAFF